MPATLVWLTTRLDWAARIIYLGHLLFILLAARKLASLYLHDEVERVSVAILLTSPILPALTAGHIEKVMSWGWILLSLYFLLNKEISAQKSGLAAGLCLGIVPLTGANYYALYAGLILFGIALALKNRRVLIYFFLGSLLGLIHLPSVWYLIGQERANAEQSIREFSMSFTGIVSSLAIGPAQPLGWETWAPIGIPAVFLFFQKLCVKTKGAIRARNLNAITPLEKTLLIALTILILLVTGIAYQGHHILDTFRVPARAMVFIALTITLFVILNQTRSKEFRSKSAYLFISALQVGIFSFMIRPYGALYGPYDPQAQRVADILNANDAKSTWIESGELNDMYIHVVLSQNGIALPNVYYGDMGQEVKIAGEYCGYSFDHLVVTSPVADEVIELKSDIEWSDVTGSIPLSNLVLIQQVKINNHNYNIYKVVCKED